MRRKLLIGFAVLPWVALGIFMIVWSGWGPSFQPAHKLTTEEVFQTIDAGINPTARPVEPTRVPFRANGYTMAQYDQITNGMSYRQVRDVLGSPGEALSSGELAGITSAVYVWKNDDGGNIIAQFQDDALIQKSQAGLR